MEGVHGTGDEGTAVEEGAATQEQHHQLGHLTFLASDILKLFIIVGDIIGQDLVHPEQS